MAFRRLMFISTKTSMFSCSMFSSNMLAIIQDLMSMTRFWMWLIIWCYDSILFGLKAMYSYVIGIWKFHWYYRAIAPSGVVYRVTNIRPSSDPWGTSKDRFRYDDRVPLITMGCLHCLQFDLNQSNGASLIPIWSNRSSSKVEYMISNAPDKLSRMGTAPRCMSIVTRRSFFFYYMHSAKRHGDHSE